MRKLCKQSKAMLAALVLFQILVGGISHASPITLDYVDSGWYSFAHGGTHDPDNLNYLAGLPYDSFFRNFFVFDLSGVTDDIIGATLKLYVPDSEDGVRNNAPYPSLTYNLFDVTTSISSLTAGGTGGLLSTWADLGSGTQYGSRNVTDSDEGSYLDIALNGNALTALNGANGLFAFGGAVTQVIPRDDANGEPYHQSVFGSSSFAPPRQLVLETQPFTQPIPEPSTMLLFNTGLAGLGLWRYRKGVKI